MNILLTTHQFFPEYAAGTEVLTYLVARELISRGHDVRVLTAFPGDSALRDDERADEYEYEGIRVYRFHHAYTAMGGQVSMIEVGYDNRLAADYFTKILQLFNPAVVHFFHLNRLGTRLIERAVDHGVPSFMTPTDFWAICPTGQLMFSDGRLCSGPSKSAGNCVVHFAQDRVRASALRVAVRYVPSLVADVLVQLTKKHVLPVYPMRAEVNALGSRLQINVERLNQLNAIVAPNRFMREKLLQYGVDAARIVESAFGIEVQPGATARRPARLGQPLRIGFIGTLAPHKGCHVLIAAFKLLPLNQAVLKIYGKREDFPEYFKLLEQLAAHHPGIEFCGVFPNSKIGEIMSSVDVLVVPSLWHENSPLTVYSAQASHCPVIASDLQGIAEIIEHEVNGLLFEAGNVAALAKQLSRLTQSAELLTILSSNSRQPKSISSYVDDLLSIWATA